MAHNDPSPEYAQYFETVPAVIVCVPPWHWHIDPVDYANLIKPLIDETVAESTDGHELHARVQNYQIGSAAEWSRTPAIVIEHAGPTTSFLASVVTIAPFALRLMKKLRIQNDLQTAEPSENESDVPPKAPPPSIGLPMVIGMASLHYRATYGPLEGVSINWFVRATDHLGSVEHPSGTETYILRLARDGENFIYHVTGEGRCTEHYYSAGGRMLALEIPNWLDEDPYHHPRQLATGRIDDQL